MKTVEPLGKSIMGSQKKNNNNKTKQDYQMNSPTSGQISKRIESRVSKRYLYTILKVFNNPKVGTTKMFNEWINKMWYILIHTIDYYSNSKSKEILCHVTVWRNLEYLILSEISEPQNHSYCMIPLIWGI